MTVIMVNSLDVADDITTALIVQLQLEDIEGMNFSSKGKGREGDLSDAEYALRLYRREFEAHSLLVSDRRMIRSIAQAVQTDGIVIAEYRL
jgi:hypothetical protein